MAYIIGVDIGTGSVKCVAVDLAGKAFDFSQQHYNFKAPEPGYHEQDPEEIWAAFKNTLAALVDKIGSAPLAVSLSSAMHSLIAVNASGEALAPMMTWADNRASAIAGDLRHSDDGMAIYKATGTPIHPMSPLCKLIWINTQSSERFKHTHKYISIKEFIWHKLFKEFVIDHSIASCTGLFDLQTLNWHPEALQLAGLHADQLSLPVKTNYLRYLQVNEDLKLSESEIPFVIGASDGCLANLGCMAFEPGIAVMTIGTSGAVRMGSPRPLPDEKTMPFSYILEEGVFICGGPINNGGIALQWWLKNMGLTELTEQVYDDFFTSANAVPAGSNGLLFLPYLTGERAPIWDSESCGAFFGLNLQHQQAHFSRAVIEGICFAMTQVLETVEMQGAEILKIHISGGFSKSEIWAQMLADITGKKLVLVQTEDASAVGATYLAMKTLGLMDVYPQADLQHLKIIHPNLAHSEIYSKNLIIFKKLYVDLQQSMHQLYQLNY